MTNYKEDLTGITTFIFDYDGVLTNGVVLITNSGDQLRTGHVKDGYALQLAIKSGYRVAVISGGYSESMRHRCNALKLTDVFLGVENKIKVFEDYIQDIGVSPNEVLYMGDDIPDYQVMLRVGMPVCPADAAEEIRKISRYISHFNGGEGCVRDVIEQVMKIQGKWMNGNAFHW
ncbi:HAD-IIIA family hydrolase [Lentimicrobium sp.]|jgi:3-deoxy-D-manno-octulosonate 8-phosphate phosphatase (KDO 8-P phosphatase)|uniref:KdsC family phosphatase n=1 Tax=Lentimicrobium sp. TaxID=2034841 RepID=UPI0025FA9A9F|nr:HAD-IIIA family hydrolase [Lentimicrobium sp.]MCO5255976.1 HAD-IIIA family hydrolase [Lentimicrobium sp.]MCO5263510.1 HAD-IIIA family hydrolase [Lentimicrobium sp.]HOP14672.1 HAD-IIIA family hydrolase [Lentimicrobium sp.]HPF65800.1 HAD-IIIA family hydrolase [Lentimicrobium sp.]HPJ61773.1 HAD-IIIA family hydrolase [Lentimicrobium sp.]